MNSPTCRILLIEDDGVAQILYRNRLADLGHEVVTSSTGAMGLMEARAGRFDLFLVDIALGSGIDGYEVCRRLKAIPELHGVPVVLVSGEVKTQEDLHRGYEAGCQCFLVKGDLMLLEDTVRAMLRMRSLQSDLEAQNQLLEDRNRKLGAERARSADLEQALLSGGRSGRELADARPDGLLLVDDEGVVRMCDRGARDLLGLGLEGRHLAAIVPRSKLEAAIRNARTEPHESLRLELAERSGRTARTLSASVFPLVPLPDRLEHTLRVVLLFDLTHRRAGGDDGSGLRRVLGPLVEAAREVFGPHALLGSSAAMHELRARLALLARSDAHVLVQGPAGSGKSLVARILHFSGARSGSLAEVDCGAFTARELELELFGSLQVRETTPGARADARPHRSLEPESNVPACGPGIPAQPLRPDSGGALCFPGALHEAHNGTLHLRNVDRLPGVLHERLLEALGRGTPLPETPAGEKNRVRVIASSRDERSRSGGPAGPLIERLGCETLSLPRLQGRPEDIELLARHFLARFRRSEQAQFDDEALRALQRHDWPDNVRELSRTVEAVCASAPRPEIRADDLPAPLAARRERAELDATLAPMPKRKSGSAPFPALGQLDTQVSLLDAYEKQALLHALHETEGDKLAAAKLVGVGKSTFYRKLKQHGLS